MKPVAQTILFLRVSHNSCLSKKLGKNDTRSHLCEYNNSSSLGTLSRVPGQERKKSHERLRLKSSSTSHLVKPQTIQVATTSISTGPQINKWTTENPITEKLHQASFNPTQLEKIYKPNFLQKPLCSAGTAASSDQRCTALVLCQPFGLNLPPSSASGLPFVFPICFCFSGPPVPCCPFPFPFWTAALEELLTLCGEDGGLLSLLLVWPLACLSFSLFFRCSCILRLLSSRWIKFVLPWERGSRKQRKHCFWSQIHFTFVGAFFWFNSENHLLLVAWD